MGAYNSGPTSDYVIAATGVPGVGNTLAAVLEPGYGVVGYQWFRDGVAIAGATASTYVEQQADVGHVLTVGPVGLSRVSLPLPARPTPAPAPAPVPAPTPGPAPAPAPVVLDTRPRIFVAPANAYSTGTQAALTNSTPLTGSANDGRAGTFSLTTTAGNFGWLAIAADNSGSGVHLFDGVGYGGWSGAGLAGNNGGASPDPSVSTTLFVDANGTQWRLFRQDYINANPAAATYTLS